MKFVGLLQRAPGARPHVPMKKDATLEEFQSVAAAFAIFRIPPSNPVRDARAVDVDLQNQ
jgi:hypothetical protein